MVAGTALWAGATLALGVHRMPSLPDMTLVRLDDGRAVSLATQLGAGQATVVNLWASWCGPCRVEMPVLAEARQRHAGRVRFVLVNQGEPAAVAQAYLQSQRLALRNVLLDGSSSLGPAMGSSGLPTTLFYDAERRLVDRHMGVLTGVALSGKLRALGLDRGPDPGRDPGH